MDYAEDRPADATSVQESVSGPLGQPLPDMPHAVSVSMPLLEHVIGYEEGDDAIHSSLRAGYPRFVFNPLVQALLQKAAVELSHPGERCVAFPSGSAARQEGIPPFCG